MNLQVVNEIQSNLDLKISYGGSFLDKKIQTHFNILHLNIQSLRNKLTTFSNFVQYSKTTYHVIVLSETHIKKDESQFFDIPCYKAVHCTREGRMSGGVSIFVRKDFSDFEILHSLDFELNSSLLIELCRFKIKILGFYRYRNCDFNNFINHITKVLDENSQSLVIGDFNIDLFTTSSSSSAKQYHDLIISSGYLFLNPFTEPSRVDPTRNSATLIDHCYSDLPLHFPHYNFTCFIDDVLGDHKAFLISINTQSAPPPPFVKKIKITKTDHAAIQKDKAIENIIYSDFETFQKDLADTFGKYTCTSIKTNRFRKPFMNVEILTLITIRQNYFKLTRRYPWSNKANTRYKYYRNEVNVKIHAAKKSFYDKRFLNNSDDPKGFWRTVNNLLTNSDGKKTSTCKSLIVHGRETTNRYNIVNAFNRFFTTIAADIKQSITINSLHFELLHDQETYTILQPISNDDLKTSEAEVALTISRLKNSFSCDTNNFSNNLFKTHIHSLALPIANLINKSISEGTFPSCLKIAKVSPLYKLSGSSKDPSNYRPLAENSLLGKCFEDFLLEKLTSHLNKNKIINANQFGFTRGSSTEVATIHLLSEVYNQLDKRKQTAVIFIDLTKAFDSIDHGLLLNKLTKLKLPSLLFAVLESYLTNRKQFVIIDDVKSSLLDVLTGVFQGSKLAACLFIIYINSIFTLPLRGSLILYADDIALIYGATDAETLKQWIEDDLTLINCWVENHFMKINLQKTKYIYFTGRARNDFFISNDINLSLNNTRLERVEFFDYLGLLIDENLNFKHHLEFIRSRMISTSFAIKRIRPFITLHTAKQLYFCRIQSLLIYLNSCWNVAYLTDIENLARCQRKVLRFIFQKPYDSPSKALFSNKILPLSHLNNFQTCILTFKLARNMLRSNIQVSVRREITNRETKQSDDFYIPVSKSWAGRSDFFKRGFDEFNKLPAELKKIKTIGRFKEELKEHLYQLYQKT
jgi:hypothetical protein